MAKYVEIVDHTQPLEVGAEVAVEALADGQYGLARDRGQKLAARWRPQMPIIPRLDGGFFQMGAPRLENFSEAIVSLATRFKCN